MTRRREPARYQLPFEFGPLPVEETTVYRALLQSLAAASESNRFVRVVREEVIVRTPADAAVHLQEKVFAPFDRLDQEELWVLLLSTSHRITHEVMLYRGTVDMIFVRPAEIFKEAVRVNAAAILLAHNHPSGEPLPSPLIWRKSQISNMEALACFSGKIHYVLRTVLCYFRFGLHS